MRVVVGEDEVLLREGLVLVLAGAGFEIAGIAADAEELMRLAAAQRPDVVLTDIRMPPTGTDDGLRAALAIRDAAPAMPVMILSQHVNRAYALELLGERSDGVGYLLKQRVANVEGFCSDLRRVASGGTVLDPEVVSAMMARASRDGASLDALTARQLEVLGLIAEGRSNAAIARELFITEKAVVQHTSHIYSQLRLAPSPDDHRRVLAVVRYLAG